VYDTASSFLTEWSTFYVITGSSAAVLIGLMFVVITLVAGDRSRMTHEGIAASSTPTVLHFCAALLVSGILSAPWPSLAHAAALLGLTGLFGFLYMSRVMIWMTPRTGYRPGIDDWLWYAIVPLIAYIAIAVAAILLPWAPTETLFALAGANVLLIFLGIHNAWDLVTFIAIKYDGPTSSSTDEDR
jgi:hypothetical protein